MESNGIFAKLSEQQKKALLEKLAKLKGLLFCKTGKDLMIRVKVHRFDKSKILTCEKIEQFYPPPADEKMVMSFTIENEKYFFQSCLTATEDDKLWEVSAETELFKLQRRDSFRIRIPDSIKTTAILKTSDTNQAFASGSVIDLSSGGCKIQLPGIFPVIPGQTVNFEMTIGRRHPFNVAGEIRHVKKIAEPKPQQTLGVMFRDMSAILESKLFTITMELHRETLGKVQGF